MSFSRHVADGPFFINVVIGTASAFTMLDQVENLMKEPGAPSLYWSLTALPRPLIGIRKSMDQEYKICERMLPEMTNLEQPRSIDEWQARLARFHGRMVRIRSAYNIAAAGTDAAKFRNDLTEFEKWALPQAKEYFAARKDLAFPHSVPEMILRFFGSRYREINDDMYKAGYLPFFEAEPFYAQGEKQIVSNKGGPLTIFSELIANVEAVHRSEAMLDRRIAMLRAVEALRLHAGVTGRLPDSLDQVKVVPIPIDPLSGKAFGYQRNGDTADLVSTLRKDQEWIGLTYQITLRK